MKNQIKSRRKFLKQIGLTSLGISSMPSSLFNLNTWAAAAANNSSINASGEYKALVCFYLYGGNDGFNMLVPKANTQYGEYQTTRGNLALAQDELLDITPLNYSGPQLGLHPSMEAVQSLFADGKLSFLANVGPKLVSDTTIENIVNQQNIPLGLFSHSDQRRQWHTGRVNERSRIGWAGKIADMLGSTCNTNTNISMNISMFNNALFLNGEQTGGFSLNKNGVLEGRLYNPGHDEDHYFNFRTSALDSMFSHDYQNHFYNNYGSILRESIDSSREYRTALVDFDNNVGLDTTFSQTEFSQNLRMVAKSIAIGEGLGFQRQIYFIHVSNFDNHGELLNTHSGRMTEVSQGLSEFYAALEELNKQDNVVTFSMSDFGRTLTSNGQGSDHAWGSNAMVMGGNVVGQSVFGNYPSLSLSSDMVYSSKGILIPGLASDLYFAELAYWFGVPMSDLGLVFPNLSEFFDVTSGTQPLGFLTI